MFLLAWSPYAIIAIISAFFYPNASDGLTGTIPAICAKR
jgi:hypothetical protein